MANSLPALQTRLRSCITKGRPFILHAAGRRRRTPRAVLSGDVRSKPLRRARARARRSARDASALQIDPVETAGRLENAATTLVVFLGLARAGGVDQAAARAHGVRRVAHHRSAARCASGASPLRVRRHRMSGSRRIVPSPEQGASTNTSRTPPERQACFEVGLHARECCRAPLASDGVAQQLYARAPHVGRDDLRACRRPSPPWRSSCRRATRRYRARACRARQRQGARRAATLRPARKQAGARQRRAQRIARCHDEAVGRVARRLDLDAVLRRALEIRPRVGLQAVHAKRQRRRGVVERLPGFGSVEAITIEPPRGEPAQDARARPRDRAARSPSGGRGGSGSRCAVSRDGPQHGVHETGGARLSRAPRHRHGVVHRRGRGHAIEVQQLIGAEPQNLEHLEVEPGERAAWRTARSDSRAAAASAACR